jgi:hypothetical protein
MTDVAASQSGPRCAEATGRGASWGTLAFRFETRRAYIHTANEGSSCMRSPGPATRRPARRGVVRVQAACASDVYQGYTP